MNRRHFEGIRSFLTYAGFRYWTASLLPALVGTTLPLWLDPPGFSFQWFAAIEFLFAAVLFHAGFSFLQASFEKKSTPVWTKSRFQIVAVICIASASILGLHINSGLSLRAGIFKSIFLMYGIVTLFVGVLYVVPPLAFNQRAGGEIVIAEGLGMIPVLGAYLVQVGDLTRTVYIASLPLVVATGLWIWVEELVSSSGDEKMGRRTLVIDLGVKFSARFGVLALAAAFFGTLLVAVVSGSTSPLALTALGLIGLVWQIVNVSWNEYAHREQMIKLGRVAFVLHLATGFIHAASSLLTQLGEAG